MVNNNPKALVEASPLFEGLSPDERASVAAICRECPYKTGEVIFQEGTSGEELYLMPRGRVSIEIGIGSDSYTERIHVATDGELFGELAMIDGHLRSATARAYEDTILHAIARKDLEKVIEKNPRIGYIVMRNLAKIVSGKLRDTTIELRRALMQQTYVLNRIY